MGPPARSARMVSARQAAPSASDSQPIPVAGSRICLKIMSIISTDKIVNWIERYAGHIAEQKDYLTELDSAIGDADHG